MQLSELERRQLQKVAHQRLQNMHLGPIIVPKDPLTKRPKKGSFLRGRHRNNSVLDSLKDFGKEGKECSNPLVFGIPLEKCIGNEHALKRYHSTRRKERRESLDLAQSPLLARQQTKVKGSAEDISSLAQSSSSGSTSSTSTSLLDALSLSTSSGAQVDAQRRERRKSLLPQEPKVPQVVKACFNHLEKRALHILGIFRVGGSKKRTRQLREDLDTGQEVILNDNHNPHDVGALLKEFFRDLPEPLLTRELYPAFVACTRLDNFEQRLRALQLLVYLLPTANRDTLHALLEFLNRVSKNAADYVDEDGNEVQGNKMDTHNLATLFGPNILRKTKGGQERDAHVMEASEQVEESREVISVVQVMTEHMETVFQVPSEIQDSVLRIAYETDPEALDYLLTKRAVALGCIDPAEMEASFTEDVESHSSSPPCTPEEILMPFHALHGHEHRLFSSPDDLYACRNKSDFTDESLGHMTREQMLQQSKQKSLSLPRAAPVIDSRFPSSPKIARTGCDDRPMSSQQDRSTKSKRGRHSSENQDENIQWGGDSSPTTTISPPTRLVRGISNEKQIFSPLSPHSPRRISGGPVSPLVGHPPERQFSSPANMDGGALSPNLEVSYQSKSPRTVRKHASDLLPSPWKLGEDSSDQIWLPVDSRRTQSVSDCIKPSRPNAISPCLPRRVSGKSHQPRLAKVPIAAMEEDFDMDLPLETSTISPTSPEKDDKQWQGKWKLKDGQETLV
ncbi:rho GTPase-activating protein 6-like [Patiria miniata]|uniref:Rho-GAP domain-containing protein n=1 Tax=Patiria miniata TaxID=46514 RepID=A0A913ZV68_PATMI|nr:rho GTPase-activating protein 6-like [Patiria miniata]